MFRFWNRFPAVKLWYLFYLNGLDKVHWLPGKGKADYLFLRPTENKSVSNGQGYWVGIQGADVMPFPTEWNNIEYLGRKLMKDGQGLDSKNYDTLLRKIKDLNKERDETSS